MAKITVITLEQAIEVKQTIQDLLTKKRNIFKLENCAPEKSERNFDLKKELKLCEQLSEWFVYLKLRVQEANLVIPEGLVKNDYFKEEYNIATLLYVLSETKSDIINFTASLNGRFWREGSKSVEGPEIIYKPLYSRAKIEGWLSKLQKKYFFIEGEMTRLNQLITIELPFDPADLQ